MSIFPKEKSGASIELGMIIVIWIKSRKVSSIIQFKKKFLWISFRLGLSRYQNSKQTYRSKTWLWREKGNHKPMEMKHIGIAGIVMRLEGHLIGIKITWRCQNLSTYTYPKQTKSWWLDVAMQVTLPLSLSLLSCSQKIWCFSYDSWVFEHLGH